MSGYGKGPQTVRVGGHVYAVNITKSEMEARNIDRERARQLSRETSRRRRALQDRRAQMEAKEEAARKTELQKRRERQRDVTERYQRGMIPMRRRFGSPLLQKSYTAPELNVQQNLHSLSETRFQSPFASGRKDQTEEDAIKAAQSRKQYFDSLTKRARTPSATKREEPVSNPMPSSRQAAIRRHSKEVQELSNFVPKPPLYAKPKSAWNDSEQRVPEEDSYKDASVEDQIDEIEDSSDDNLAESIIDETLETNENETFDVEPENAQIVINRCSTPDDLAEVTAAATLERQAAQVPTPPNGTRPDDRVDPRKQMMLKKLSDSSIKTESVIEFKSMSRINETADEVSKAADTQPKGILKKKRSQRRVVSAAGNRGIIAASIRDSLEISKKSADEETVEVRRNVVWDKLYYDDNTTAEFGADGRAVSQDKEPKKKNPRRVKLSKSKSSIDKKSSSKSSSGTTTGKTPSRAKKAKKAPKVASTPQPPPSQMQSYHSAYSVTPFPSSGAQLKTDYPQYQPAPPKVPRPEQVSRTPMPPSVPKPLISRTQILRTKKSAPVTNPVKVMHPKQTRPDQRMMINSNNQTNINIGSVEISPEPALNRTPTDNDINWLWERVRSVLETQQQRRPKSSTVYRPKPSNHPTMSKTRPHSAHVLDSNQAFLVAEHLAQQGIPNDRIMTVLNPATTTISMEEAQIEQSLQRLDERLYNIQENVGYNGIVFHNRH